MDGGATTPFWSTDSVERARQFGFWREAVCQAFLQLTVECPIHDEFRGRIDSRPVGAVVLNRVDAQHQTVRLDRRGLARSAKNCFYINFQAAGAGLIRQNGKEARVGTGEWYVLDSTTPFELLYDKAFVSFNFEVDQSLLGTEARLLRGMVGRALGSRPGMQAYIADHALLLSRHIDTLPQSQRDSIGQSFIDLLARTCDGDADPGLSGPVHRHRKRAELYIREHLADSGLRPAAIAAGCNVSLRRLHALFAVTGETVMQYIRTQRLLLAYNRLNSNVARGQTITEIALDCGFADSAHFCHVFKAMFRKTPREIRSREP